MPADKGTKVDGVSKQQLQLLTNISGSFRWGFIFEGSQWHAHSSVIFCCWPSLMQKLACQDQAASLRFGTFYM